MLNPELVKGPWLKEEDEKIISLVAELGAKQWSKIAQQLPGRIGKQCRKVVQSFESGNQEGRLERRGGFAFDSKTPRVRE